MGWFSSETEDFEDEEEVERVKKTGIVLFVDVSKRELFEIDTYIDRSIKRLTDAFPTTKVIGLPSDNTRIEYFNYTEEVKKPDAKDTE